MTATTRTAVFREMNPAIGILETATDEVARRVEPGSGTSRDGRSQQEYLLHGDCREDSGDMPDKASELAAIPRSSCGSAQRAG
jgi:hypothetical protein